MCKNTYSERGKKTEPDSSQWYPWTGQEAISTQEAPFKHKKSLV